LRNFAKFCEISQNLWNNFAENSRNFAKHFSISRNFVVLLVSRKKFREISSNTYFGKWFRQNFEKFRELFLYFAIFCRVISFAKEILRNFVIYLFREMILPKFREFSRNTFWISQNFIVLIVSRKKSREISSNTYFTKWFAEILLNFAKYLSYFAKYRRKTSFLKRNFASYCEILLHKILRNFAKLIQKFREIFFRETFVASLPVSHQHLSKWVEIEKTLHKYPLHLFNTYTEGLSDYCIRGGLIDWYLFIKEPYQLPVFYQSPNF